MPMTGEVGRACLQRGRGSGSPARHRQYLLFGADHDYLYLEYGYSLGGPDEGGVCH